MITFKNYNEATKGIDWKALPEVLKRTHEQLMPDAQAGAYESDADVKRVVETYIAKLNEAASKLVKPTVKEKPTKPNTTKPTKEMSNHKLVERLDDDVTLIKKYVNFHKKQKSREQVQSLLNAVQKAILEKRVNKHSAYGKEVMEVQDYLRAAIKMPGKAFDFEIDKKTLERYNEIISSVSAMTSIQLIKRYVGLQNKAAIKDKANRLLTAITKFTSINKSDKYHAYLKVAETNLVEYLNNKRATVRTFTDAQLHGINGLGFFPSIFTSIASGAASAFTLHHLSKKKKGIRGLGEPGTETVIPYKGYEIRISKNKLGYWFGVYKPGKTVYELAIKGSVPTPEKAEAEGRIMIDGLIHKNEAKKSGPEPEVMSVNDVKNGAFKVIAIKGDFLKLIGEFCFPTSFMFYGKGGSGKSGSALSFADQLHKLGKKVLYIAGEQYGTPSFTKLINDTKITGGPGFDIVKSLDSQPMANYDVIAIDSKDNLNLDHSSDFSRLKEAYPDKTFILTSQGTKTGDFTGDGKWTNEVETWIRFNNGTASTLNEKNRWGGKAEIKLF